MSSSNTGQGQSSGQAMNIMEMNAGAGGNINQQSEYIEGEPVDAFFNDDDPELRQVNQDLEEIE